MTLQAQAMGLAVRQFRAFDRAGLSEEFDVPPHWEVTTMSALGRARRIRPDESGRSPARQRRELAELRWPVASDVR
jgi:hypothetical protein